MFTRFRRYSYRAKTLHSRIVSHPHYELIIGHAMEGIAIMVGSFIAIGYSATGSLPVNDSFIYPLQEISHPNCKFEDRETLAGDCVIQLPRIKQANYDAYLNDPLVRGVYSVLRSSSYDDGWDRKGGHSGVDFRTSKGTPVVSIGNGVVVQAGVNVGYGNVVKIKYQMSNGEIIYAVYAHLDSITTHTDATVTKGQKVGTVGESGLAYGVHLHYEIDTTTKRGKPLYPYADCEERDAYLQNNTDICIDQLREHTKDPVVFHEKYFSTLVAGTDPSVPITQPDPVPTPDPNEHHPAPEAEPTPEPAPTLPEPKQNNITTEIDPIVIDTEDQKLQTIYDIIEANIPHLDIGTLSADAQSFFDTYGLEITHKLSPTTTLGEDTLVELYIYNKATKQPFSGILPISIDLVTTNKNIRTLPSSIENIQNGRTLIRLRGMNFGPSIAGFTIDNTIFYALPVLVQ